MTVSAGGEEEGRMNNYQWLLQMDGTDRKAWFDAEHVEHQERALDGDTDAQNEDSRELILTDLEKKTREWRDYDGNYMRIYSDVAYAQMKELLDRQAAITEREVLSHPDERDEQIAEMTAERDVLKGQMDTMRDVAREFRNERDLYRSKLGTCADLAEQVRNVAMGVMER